MSTAAKTAFTPLTIGPLKLRNRFVKAATNEGMCKGGVISKGLAQFHRNMAKGGAALSTVAYCATSSDGRTFVDQARLDADTVPDFKVPMPAVLPSCPKISSRPISRFRPRAGSTRSA